MLYVNLSLAVTEVSFLHSCTHKTCWPATWAVMFFFSSIPWDRRLCWATFFFPSFTQTGIITVQLLACVAVAGRVVLGLLLACWTPLYSASRRLSSVRCNTFKKWCGFTMFFYLFIANCFVLCYQQYRALLYMYTSLLFTLVFFFLNISSWLLWIIFLFVMFYDVKCF